MLGDESLEKKRVRVSEAGAIDSISMTTNTLKHNKPMLQVPTPFRKAWNGLVVTYKSQLSAKLPSLERYVSDHRGGEGGEQKATDTSKPLKNVMVFVEDLASGVAV